MIKRLRGLHSGIFCMLAYASCGAVVQHTSQTFMFPRPVYNNLGMINSGWLYLAMQQNHPHGGNIQVVPCYLDAQERTCGTKNDGYFSINCKPTVLFAGDNSSFALDRDVRAEWFGLPADFSGEITFHLKHRQVGLLFMFQQNFDAWFTHDMLRYFYASIQVPVVWVQNTLGLTEHDFVQGTPVEQGAPRTILEAMRQPALEFAKMFPGCFKDQGIAELRLDIGTKIVTERDYLLVTYSSLIFPTFRKNNPCKIFGPVVGINGHIALCAGMNMQIPLTNECTCFPLMIFCDIDNRYYFNNKEYRTFDLKRPRLCEPLQWTRYLQVRQQEHPDTTFAANVLTLPVKVKPYNMVNITAGFRAYYGWWHVELGYQLWVHSSEKVRLKEPSCEDSGYCFERFGIAGPGLNTASRSTIAHQAESDVIFVPLKLDDLNLRSAAARGTATNMAYGSLIFISENERFAPMVAFGLYAEQSISNAAFSTWGLWGKLGGSF